MKNLSAFLGMLMLCMLLTGCPYESSVPIKKSGTKLNPLLLGKWKADDGKMTVSLSKRDDFTYDINVDNGNNTTDQYFGFLSDVKGTTFLNLGKNTPGSSDAKFNFYKIEFSGNNTLMVSPVTGNVREKFSSPEEWERFVGENMKNSYFFEETGKFEKTGM